MNGNRLQFDAVIRELKQDLEISLNEVKSLKSCNNKMVDFINNSNPKLLQIKNLIKKNEGRLRAGSQNCNDIIYEIEKIVNYKE